MRRRRRETYFVRGFARPRRRRETYFVRGFARPRRRRETYFVRGFARAVGSACMGSSGHQCLGYWPLRSAFTAL
ncbi:hypothetical protein MTBUT4_190078 [Magnetospirillum sp. UT-4]|nr:hypothetical protein MTBUT4_190078 [Magnetospirillum sp. UT-4]